MQRKPMAILLILLGLVGLFFGLIGINQKTAEFNIGGIQASATEKRTIPALAAVGAIFVVGGIVVLAMDRSKP